MKIFWTEWIIKVFHGLSEDYKIIENEQAQFKL